MLVEPENEKVKEMLSWARVSETLEEYLEWLQFFFFLLSCLTIFASLGQGWRRQTHSAVDADGRVWVQPLSSPLVSPPPPPHRLMYFLPLFFSLHPESSSLTSGRREWKSSRGKQTQWRCWGPCAGRRTNSRSPRRDFLHTPCWLWSGDSSDPEVQCQERSAPTTSWMRTQWLRQDARLGCWAVKSHGHRVVIAIHYLRAGMLCIHAQKVNF